METLNSNVVAVPRKGDSAFQALIRYINAHKIGDLITRKNLVKFAKEYKISENYLDTTRRKLTASGYLTEHDRRGVFVFSRRPKNLTSSILDKEYYLSTRSMPLDKTLRAHNYRVFKFLTFKYDEEPQRFTEELKTLYLQIDGFRDGGNVHEILWPHVARERSRSNPSYSTYSNRNWVMKLYITYLQDVSRFIGDYNRWINSTVYEPVR